MTVKRAHGEHPSGKEYMENEIVKMAGTTGADEQTVKMACIERCLGIMWDNRFAEQHNNNNVYCSYDYSVS